ncbi:hypothetical protein K469DRAFT_575932 [Zopfia rhizophila CBS 207.26]|uniref:Zn(2)-C6 fungal-type domain-containing protein n=1 Tax=Zopfia rhizophila CBS 207.26 TaxID=1314779 RepID=A0A6A6E6I5_9PEZI|nr:hypothetical protein K469DRAFT_575932 [Zopfia rhizophila CBS 207.26]
MQTQKETRAVTSCSECQRRKQKCSREWPCNHCQARKVPHRCQFGQKKTQESASDASRYTNTITTAPTLFRTDMAIKRSITDTEKSPSAVYDDPNDDPSEGLKVWGYMPGHVHYNLCSGQSEDTQKTAAVTASVQSDVVENVLHTIPALSLTDSLVNHFLYNVNARYNSIYAPGFTEDYVQWWNDRINGKRLSPEFTCLLLRVCAYSSQYITPALRRNLEFELASNAQTLTGRFHRAAEQLSGSFTPANTCLARVQELFLKAASLKSESDIVGSWHVLGSAIREAQELGLDKDTGIEKMTEYEIELRRRVWCLLYCWDWQCSAWLGRPRLIDHKGCSFTYPNLRLDQSKSQPNLVSPFAHIALQARLGRGISMKTEEKAAAELSAEQVLAVEDEIESFVANLPPIFRLIDPDTSLDEEHPYIILQRRTMHVVIYMTMFDPLKPYLTQAPGTETSHSASYFRNTGVDTGLKLLAAARLLFDHEFPINAKFHFIVFCLFDTAAILCSAIIHDREENLPRRDEVMDAVERSLDMLHQLSLTTKIGALSYKYLFKLVQAAPILSQHFPLRKRQKEASTTSAPEPLIPDAQQGSFTLLPIVPMVETASTEPPVAATDDLSSDLDQFLQHNPFGTSSTLEIGGLEQIWDWDTLNLDDVLNQGWNR